MVGNHSAGNVAPSPCCLAPSTSSCQKPVAHPFMASSSSPPSSELFLGNQTVPKLFEHIVWVKTRLHLLSCCPSYSFLDQILQIWSLWEAFVSVYMFINWVSARCPGWTSFLNRVQSFHTITYSFCVLLPSVMVFYMRKKIP